jgi:hypothetical protein
MSYLHCYVVIRTPETIPFSLQTLHSTRAIPLPLTVPLSSAYANPGSSSTHTAPACQHCGQPSVAHRLRRLQMNQYDHSVATSTTHVNPKPAGPIHTYIHICAATDYDLRRQYFISLNASEYADAHMPLRVLMWLCIRKFHKLTTLYCATNLAVKILQ